MPRRSSPRSTSGVGDLAYKRGAKRIAASRTKAMIKRWCEKEAVRRTLTKLSSTGPDLLAKIMRLDCAYEQIILDFSNEFDPKMTAKAAENLACLPVELKQDLRVIRCRCSARDNDLTRSSGPPAPREPPSAIQGDLSGNANPGTRRDHARIQLGVLREIAGRFARGAKSGKPDE
jgi:hypothetical protein